MKREHGKDDYVDSFVLTELGQAYGFNYEIVGRIHYVDPIHKEVRLKTEADEVERFKDGGDN
ncbi:hypothetical protein H7T43_06290 [Peribacillus simplex]|uniref:YolD-like family protein n=1 Tax=Peribacillus TaxID=2675229 RepID=UPI002162BAB5|nr:MULTISPECIES: YolD-like family protein [Peribacillus]MBX9954518.1 hypothetical protein [Peribacillus simplex]